MYWDGCAIIATSTEVNAPAAIRSCFPQRPSSAGVPITDSYKTEMCGIHFFLKIIPRTVLKFQFIIIVNIKAISMKRKYTPSGPEKGLHQEPYSLQNNGTMHIWCAAPSGATQFYRGVLCFGFINYLHKSYCQRCMLCITIS